MVKDLSSLLVVISACGVFSLYTFLARLTGYPGGGTELLLSIAVWLNFKATDRPTLTWPGTLWVTDYEMHFYINKVSKEVERMQVHQKELKKLIGNMSTCRLKKLSGLSRPLGVSVILVLCSVYSVLVFVVYVGSACSIVNKVWNKHERKAGFI